MRFAGQDQKSHVTINHTVAATIEIKLWILRCLEWSVVHRTSASSLDLW